MSVQFLVVTKGLQNIPVCINTMSFILTRNHTTVTTVGRHTNRSPRWLCTNGQLTMTQSPLRRSRKPSSSLPQVRTLTVVSVLNLRISYEHMSHASVSFVWSHTGFTAVASAVEGHGGSRLWKGDLVSPKRREASWRSVLGTILRVHGVKGAKKQGLGEGKGRDLRQGDLQTDGKGKG